MIPLNKHKYGLISARIPDRETHCVRLCRNAMKYNAFFRPFVDCGAEREICKTLFLFRPDMTLRGWLDVKHQVSTYLPTYMSSLFPFPSVTFVDIYGIYGKPSLLQYSKQLLKSLFHYHKETSDNTCMNPFCHGGYVRFVDTPLGGLGL